MSSTKAKVPSVRVEEASVEKRARLWSDVGVAARLAIAAKSQHLYVEGLGWLHYDGCRWVQDRTQRILNAATNTALRLPTEIPHLDQEARATAWKIAPRYESRERLNAIIELAKMDLAGTAEQLDADPYALNLLNGTLELRTLRMRAHSPADLITQVANARYNAQASAPRFVAAVARIFRGQPETGTYVLRGLGYALAGDPREQCAFFFHGAGNNGKTLLLSTAAYVMGDYATKAAGDLVDDRETHPACLADLRGKRFAELSEFQEGKPINEARFKSITGDRVVKARLMRQDFFSFPMQAKLFVATNHRPIIRGTDNGIWRRIRLVPFLESIPEAERIPDLATQLQAEADGIMQLLVQGCSEWMQHGLGEPAEIKEATADYRGEQDALGQFLAEQTEPIASDTERATDLYQRYSKWADAAGEHPVSQKRFGMQLRERGFEGIKNTFGFITWRGISLRPEPSSDDQRTI